MKSKHKKAFIIGYFGFQNLGDEAISYSMKSYLLEKGISPTFLVNKDTKQNFYKSGNISRGDFHYILLEIMKSDIVIFGGGGLLHNHLSKFSIILYIVICLCARMLCKPIIIFNQSYGPIDKTGEILLKYTIGNQISYFRDKDSYIASKKIFKNSQLGGDPVILLPKYAKLPMQEKQIALIPRADYEEATNKLLELAKILKLSGYKVNILAFDEKIDWKVLIERKIDVIMCDDVAQTTKLIAQQDYVISMRLHGVIIAASQSVPYIGISYDSKVAGFCSDSGALCCDLNFDPIDVFNKISNSVDVHRIDVAKMKERCIKSYENIEYLLKIKSRGT